MKKTLQIKDISGGLALTTYGPEQKNAYDSAIGIDPDFRSAQSSRTGGAITPTAYAKFSGAGLATSASVNWIMTTPKDATSYIYAYATDGSFLRYTYTAPSYASETALTTPTSGAGNGMAYYNNYIYLATPTDIARYGPLDNSPSLTQTVWTGGTFLGNAKYALSNTTYPSFQAGAVLKTPNHAMHVHTDGFLYFCDVVATTYTDNTAIQGKGVLHRISTKKTTDQGDTNNGSAYNVLELPFGWFPIAIESYGTDLAIIAIPGTSLSSLTLSRGNAALFLWDTFASIPYKQVTLPDPIASAILNVNGKLHIWSGNTAAGTRVSIYNGGENVQQDALLTDSMTPPQGAVGAFGDKVFFGGYISYPAPVYSQLACVYSLSSKLSSLPHSSLHVPAHTSNADSFPCATAICVAVMDNMVRPTPVFAYADAASSGICSFKTTSTQSSYFLHRWEIGQPFSVRSVRFSLDQAVSSGVSVTPTLLVDNNTTSTILSTTNNTTQSGKTVIAYKRPEVAVVGQENLTLQFSWTGTVAASIIFPVEVEIDVFDVVKTG